MTTSSDTTEGRGLHASDLVRLTGASYRMLDYWRRTGRLVPRAAWGGSGNHCVYGPEAPPVIRALRRWAHAEHEARDHLVRLVSGELTGSYVRIAPGVYIVPSELAAA